MTWTRLTSSFWSLVAVGLAAAGLPSPVSAGEPNSPAPSWEYKAVSFGNYEAEATEKLTRLAADGWEYLGPLANGLVAFRRPVVAAADPAAKKELEKLQGSWVLVSLRWDGEEQADDGQSIITIRGDQCVNAESKTRQTIKIREVGDDLVQVDFVDGSDGGPAAVTRAIYRLEGDTLTICGPMNSRDKRPTAFKAGKGDELTLTKLRREKK